MLGHLRVGFIKKKWVTGVWPLPLVFHGFIEPEYLTVSWKPILFFFSFSCRHLAAAVLQPALPQVAQLRRHRGRHRSRDHSRLRWQRSGHPIFVMGDATNVIYGSSRCHNVSGHHRSAVAQLVERPSKVWSSSIDWRGFESCPETRHLLPRGIRLQAKILAVPSVVQK